MRPALLGSLAALLLLALAPAYWTAMKNPIAGAYHDDGIYLVTAKALATGQGYRIISLPDSIAQTKYPPVYPWLLSLVWRAAPSFPQNLTALLSVSLIACVFWISAVYVLARQEGLSQTAAFFVASISATSVWTLALSTMALSETTFAALCTGSLVCLKLAEGKENKRTIVFSALLAGLAFLTRSIGITIPIAAIIWLLHKRRFREALLFGLVAAALMAPWFAWVGMHKDPTGWVEAYYSAQSYKINSVFSSFTLRQKINIISTNLLLFLFAPATLLNLCSGLLGLLLGVDIIFLLLLARSVMRRFRLLPMVCAAYALVLVCTCGGLGVRYAAPIFPILLIIAAQEITMRSRYVVRACALVTGLVLCHSLVRFYVSANEMAAGHKAWTSLKDNNRGEMEKAVSWIRANVPENKVISANLDPLFYLYTGHRAIRSFTPNFYEMYYELEKPERALAGTADDLRRELRTNHVDYLVITRDEDFLESPFLHGLEKQLIQDLPSAFHRAYKGSLPGYEIFSVDWKKL